MFLNLFKKPRSTCLIRTPSLKISSLELKQGAELFKRVFVFKGGFLLAHVCFSCAYAYAYANAYVAVIPSEKNIRKTSVFVLLLLLLMFRLMLLLSSLRYACAWALARTTLKATAIKHGGFRASSH